MIVRTLGAIFVTLVSQSLGQKQKQCAVPLQCGSCSYIRASKMLVCKDVRSNWCLHYVTKLMSLEQCTLNAVFLKNFLGSLDQFNINSTTFSHPIYARVSELHIEPRRKISFSDSPFGNMEQLNKLTISNCYECSIDRNTFVGLNKLEILRLERLNNKFQNQSAEIHELAFEMLPDLKKLLLVHNNVVDLTLKFNKILSSHFDVSI